MSSYELLFGEVVHITPKAVLFEYLDNDETVEIWIPKSVIDDGEEVSIGDSEIYVQRWYCEKQDLI